MTYRVITGTLKARTAVHVGSGEENELADSLLRRDTEGNILIPGTAIAGALRSMLTRLAPRLGGGVCVELLPPKKRKEREQEKKKGCDCAVCRLFGDVEPSDEAGGEESTSSASRLLVFNAYPSEKAVPQTLVRDGVGIDRASGAAARAVGAKFALETLSAAAEFNLRIELREPESATDEEIEQDEQLLAVALAEWKAGRAYLGGGVARGLGAFDLKKVKYGERNLDDEDGLMAFLRDSEPWENVEKDENWLRTQLDRATANLTPLQKAQRQAMGMHDLNKEQAQRLPITTGWAKWTFTLQAEGPFLTNDATSSGMSGFNHAPLLAQIGDWTKPVLPGSSLRGVLRSHAERIARTLATHRAIEKYPEQERERRKEHFLDRCPACDPLVHRRRSEDKLALESCDSLLRYKAKVSENKEISPEQLCLACQLFGSTRRGSRLIVEDVPYCGDKLPEYKMLDFLAVDRFTGGGAEHFKFDALALWRPAFEVRLFLENPDDWELGWLTLVLRDLAEGWLRVGFGAAKGFGKVTITGGALRVARLNAAQAESDQKNLFVVDEYPLFDNDQASTWVEAFNEALESFNREKDLAPLADSYFGVMDEIYGGEGS